MAEQNFQRIIFYGDRGADFPLDDSDVTKYCRDVKENLKNYTQFTECMRPFPKRIFGMVAKGFKKFTASRCENPKWRKEFIDFGKCVKNNKLEGELHGCIDKATLMNEFLEQKVKLRFRIPMSCCVTQVMSNCFRVKTKVCGNELSAFPFNMINEPISEVFELMCNSLDSLKKCTARYPRTMKGIRDLLRTGVKPNGSFFNSQLRIASSMNT